jgi:hypothetical protein
MLHFVARALLSGFIIAAVSAIARRSPTFAALVATLPLVSVLSMIWLWHDTHDAARVQAQAAATFWYVLPSLPMFLLMPALMRAGVAFYPALLAGCALTTALYLGALWVLPRLGVAV